MKMYNVNYTLFRLYGYPGFGILVYLVIFLINPYEPEHTGLHYFLSWNFLLEASMAVLYASALFEIGIQLTKLLNSVYSWERHIKIRFLVQFLIHSALAYIILNLLFLIKVPVTFYYDELMFRQALIVGTIFSLLITAVFAAEYFFYRWNDASLKALELQQYTTQAQLEALKLQLDPHFLFNNLSILTALIEDEPSTATTYLSNLSSIYRYMLANRLKDLILLREELTFIEAYLFLYKIRYGNGIIIDIAEHKNIELLRLPPLTLQLLIENAIKHNTFSTQSPLKIKIYFTEHDKITVENNKKLKKANGYSSRIGLKNIDERYRLMGHTKPIVTETDELFKVAISLITINP